MASMKLYTATVNLPKESHSEHSVISPDMYAFQNKTIILSEMNPDPDYEYHSYHKKFSRLWWWNTRWLDNIELLTDYTNHNNIMDINDPNNSVIDDSTDLKELKDIFIFLNENYKFCAISKRYDAVEVAQEMYLKTQITVNPINMKRGLILFGCKTKRLN